MSVWCRCQGVVFHEQIIPGRVYWSNGEAEGGLCQIEERLCKHRRVMPWAGSWDWLSLDAAASHTPLCIEGESQSDSTGHLGRSTKRMNESYLTLPDAPTGSPAYVSIHSTYVLLLIDRTGPGEETVDGLPAGAQAVLC